MAKSIKNVLVAILTLTLGCLFGCKKDNASNGGPEFDNNNHEVSSLALQAASSNILSGSNLELGIVGHPLGGEPYIATAAKEQIKLLNSMRMTWYRFGITSQSDGTVTVPKLLDPLLTAARNGKVKLLANLRPRTMNLNDSESDAYAKGKKLGANFAQKYGSYFSHYDLGNDLDLLTKLSGTTGQSQEHYDKKKTKSLIAYLKGMDEGIKSKDADAKTMVSAGWLHYAFIRMCEWYGVKFDIVAYHWYSDMEIEALKSPKISDITQKLSSLFPKKPIWFTEFNYRYSSKKTQQENESAQENFISLFIEKCKRNPQVKVAMVYELFDEPYKSEQESNYGIAKWAKQYTLWEGKTVMKLLVGK